MRVFISLIIMVLTTANGTAQELRYGVKGGLNISDVVLANFINPDVESDYRIKAGYHAGVFVSADLTDQFAVDTELLFSVKGTKAGERINLYYITIPFLIRYKLANRISLGAGPEFGYLVSARSPLGDVSNTWNNKLDFGLDVDARLSISDNLQLGLRYNAGFSSVIDTRGSAQATGETVKYQNRTLQLSLYLAIAEKMF